jgi:hypothetical protein
MGTSCHCTLVAQVGFVGDWYLPRRLLICLWRVEMTAYGSSALPVT